MRRDLFEFLNMDYMNSLIHSVHLKVRKHEPEILDIETGEMIPLNGHHNPSYDIARLSVMGEFSIDEQFPAEKNGNSNLDFEL